MTSASRCQRVGTRGRRRRAGANPRKWGPQPPEVAVAGEKTIKTSVVEQVVRARKKGKKKICSNPNKGRPTAWVKVKKKVRPAFVEYREKRNGPCHEMTASRREKNRRGYEVEVVVADGSKGVRGHGVRRQTESHKRVDREKERAKSFGAEELEKGEEYHGDVETE